MLALILMLTLPAGWKEESTGGKTRAYSPDRSEFVAVEAVLAKAGQDALTLLRSVANRFPSMKMVASRGQVGQAEALLAGAGAKAQAMLVLRGGAATLYLASAPEARFAQRLPALVGILKSFSLGQPAGTSMKYTRLDEPREQSYSIELPAGWRNELGLYRMGSNDNRYETSSISPDGNVTVFLGDRNVGNYVVPTQDMAGFGFREGSMYNPSGTSAQMLLRYLPGAQFGQYWLNMRLRGAQVLGQKERPDINQQMAQARYRYGNPMNATLHSGEVSFEYQGKRGTVVVTTEIYGMANLYSWRVAYLCGYFAAPGYSGQAAEVLAHAISTARPNLNWLRMDREYARIDHTRAMETNQEINRIYQSTMTERSQSAEARARATGDLLSGTYRIVDPTTNEQATVQAGSNFYYRINNTNTVIGTNIEQTPVDLTRMLRLDWDIR